MASMSFDPPDKWLRELEKLGDNIGEACKKAVIKGAQPMADEIRRQIEGLPEDKFRYLTDNDAFSGIPSEQKKDLLNGLGITKADIDFNGNYNVKVGFDGYGRHKTKKYPKGLPNQLLARSIESGSSVRVKTPFVKTSVKKKKNEVLRIVEESIQSSINNYNL